MNTEGEPLKGEKLINARLLNLEARLGTAEGKISQLFSWVEELEDRINE